MTAFFPPVEHDPVASALVAAEALIRAAADATLIPLAQKGAANGVVQASATGGVRVQDLPADAVELRGVWNATTNTPTLADGSGRSGDMYRVNVAGTRNLGSGSIDFNVGDELLLDDSLIWAKVGAGAVLSVAGKTGTVALVRADVGLPNVDNTSDVNKPVSTAQAAADGLRLLATSNLSDIPAPATARGNLGLGSAATQASSAFDGAGAAAAILSNDLAGVHDTGTARANLRVPDLATQACAATANVASLSGLQTFDNYTLLDGDQVLLPAQADQTQNGPWVAHAGAWIRPTDFPSGAVVKGRSVMVAGGTLYAGTRWVLPITSSITIDAGAQPWRLLPIKDSQLSSAVDTGSLVYASAVRGTRDAWALRDFVSVKDFGAVGDYNQTGTGITISAGSLNQGTLGTVPSDLKPLQAMVIEGLTSYVVVLSINTTTKVVTFTGNASGAVTAARCAWGTDNTVPLNTAIAYALANKCTLVWPGGGYLITATVGRDPTLLTGQSGLTILCAGAGLNTARLAQLGVTSATRLIWGGAAGGLMSTWNRLQHLHFVGGIAFVGQPSSDPSGFSTFGNRAGLGFLLSQDSTMGGATLTGTGYCMFDDVVFEDMTLGFQFGQNAGDNNCDTTRFGRVVGSRCDQLGRVVDAQGMAYTFGFVHTISTPRGIAFDNGGGFECQYWNVSGCDGSTAITGTGTADGSPVVTGVSPVKGWLNGMAVTANGVATTLLSGAGTSTLTFAAAIAAGAGITLTGSPTFQLEASGQTWAFTYNISTLRIESASASIVKVGSEASEVTVGNFVEAQTAVNKTLFRVLNGVLRIGIAKLESQGLTPGSRPFYSDATSSKTGKIVVDDLIATGPGGVINIAALFEYGTNAVTDVTVRSLRDQVGRTYNAINSKLNRGLPVFMNATTTTTTTVVLTMAGTPATGITFGYGPRVPKGYSILDVYIVGDRGDGTFSVFRRQIECWRTSGNTTLVSTTTVGTDSVQGTDNLAALSIDASTHVLHIGVGGTVGKTITWQATCTARAFTAAVDL